MGSLIFILEACLHIYISVILLSNKDKQTKFLWMFAGFAFLHPFFHIKIVPNHSFFFCFLFFMILKNGTLNSRENAVA